MPPLLSLIAAIIDIYFLSMHAAPPCLCGLCAITPHYYFIDAAYDADVITDYDAIFAAALRHCRRRR